MASLDNALLEKKRELALSMYARFMEDADENLIVDNPEILFDVNYLDSIPDVRRRIFLSQFSNVCIFAEPSEFDFGIRRNITLFRIMQRQLQLYCPLSPEYEEVVLFIEHNPLIFGRFDRFHAEPRHHLAGEERGERGREIGAGTRRGRR